MRYSYYWIPKNDTQFGRYGADWFSSHQRFKKIIRKKCPEYKNIDFLSALEKISQYGFHAEIIAPFKLAKGRTEADAFLFLKNLVRFFTKFDLTLRLSKDGNRIYLDSPHDVAIFQDIKKKFCMNINSIISDPIDLKICLSPLEMNLAMTDNEELCSQIYDVAFLYWQEILKKNITFEAISLCYQKNASSPFKELTRLSLKMVY